MPQQNHAHRLHGEFDGVGILDFRMALLPGHGAVARRRRVHVLKSEDLAEEFLRAIRILIQLDPAEGAGLQLADGRLRVCGVRACAREPEQQKKTGAQNIFLFDATKVWRCGRPA